MRCDARALRVRVQQRSKLGSRAGAGGRETRAFPPCSQMVASRQIMAQEEGSGSKGSTLKISGVMMKVARLPVSRNKATNI